MSAERVETSLRFLGDWPWWAGVGLALALGVAAWIMYRRETRSSGWWVHWLLPTLRALVVVMIALLLAGPVLHHRKVVGQLSRVLLCVDGSKSMGLTDPGMELGRKILICERLGLLREGTIPMDLPEAVARLGEGEALTGRARRDPAKADARIVAQQFAARMEATREALARAEGEAARLAAFTSELGEPSRALAAAAAKESDPARIFAELTKLGDLAENWQTLLRERFEKTAADLAARENSPLRAALAAFDALPRTRRLQAMLLESGPPKRLAQWSEKHAVQLLDLQGAEARRIWQPSASDSAVPRALPEPDGAITDLSIAFQEKDDPGRMAGPGAVVIFTDGQHNAGESPVEAARMLAARGWPVFTVGFGNQRKPPDVAVMRVDGPDAVFLEDRVRGSITFKDDMPAGRAFAVRIMDGKEELWQQALVTEGSGVRKVMFEFPLSAELKARLKAKPEGMEASAVALDLTAAIAVVEGDLEPANNEGGLRFRVITQQRRVLVLDGRPRWETRYLRNVFERNEQWEVSTVIVGSGASAQELWRGDGKDQFPTSAALLQNFDLVIFGEVPRSAFKNEELEWLRDFVANRGGAMILIDGARQRFKEYADSPLAALFPVEWKGPDTREGIAKLGLTERGAKLAALALSSEPTRNAEIWNHLPPPHWLSGANALPGAEVLAEAEIEGKKMPAVVTRPFGAGKVLYHAFDESWRWRYEVADLYHVRYWNQIASWIAENPFAASDKFVSLDAGGITYRPGETAEIKVRLRDGEGRPVINAGVDAVLTRDGKRVATVPLVAEENAGGLFRGRTAALELGTYAVTVESPAILERDAKARTEFKVETQETGELVQLSLNEELLQQVSATTAGQYLREEDIDQLTALLAPSSQGRVVESETVLRQSWWWFVPIVLLLTIEWIVRKRVGML
jgi:hypothetical protein